MGHIDTAREASSKEFYIHTHTPKEVRACIWWLDKVRIMPNQVHDVVGMFVY